MLNLIISNINIKSYHLDINYLYLYIKYLSNT